MSDLRTTTEEATLPTTTEEATLPTTTEEVTLPTTTEEATLPTTTEEVILTTPPNWRQEVFMADTFSQESQDFLDEHVRKGKLSKTGNFMLKNSVGTLVPYELCPPRVKRIMQKINAEGDLPRSAFKSIREYRTGIINLHIYGYLHELKDKTLMQKRRVQANYLKKWGRDNSAKTKGYAANAKKYRSKWRNEVDILQKF
jgi:hypothetical protein